MNRVRYLIRFVGYVKSIMLITIPRVFTTISDPDIVVFMGLTFFVIRSI